MRSPSSSLEIVGARSRRGGAVLVSVLVLCVLILSAQAPSRNRPGTVLQSWILTVVSPVARAIVSVSRGVTDAADTTVGLFTARSENAELKSEIERQDLELFRLRAMVAQAERNRLLAESVPGLPGVLTTAPILLLERRAGLQSAVVGAGSREGVRTGSPLAVTHGLVGRVVSVGRGVSRAQLLTDVSAAAGARIVRTGELGVIRGDGRGGFRLSNVPIPSTVKAGDLVESAGIDGIYPGGVPIGRVESVSHGSSLFLEIRVRPAADFDRLTDVLILAPSPAAGEASGGLRGAGS